MALYVLGDTHFSEGSGKPMDIFGGAWCDSRRKLLEGLSVLEEGDTLVLCGDFSWGMSLDEALPDFKLLHSFPGRKLIVKGNHDYWWETASKMQRFLCQNGIEKIEFLHNNCFFYGNAALCGSRGWVYDKSDPACEGGKIFRRECLRLEASLKLARDTREGCETYAFLHYPPIFGGEESAEITALLQKYCVTRCFYGHLHGHSIKSAFCGEKGGVYYSLVSADAIGFKPLQILE